MNLIDKIKSLLIPTVDSIVADFTKAEKRLQALAKARLAKADTLNQKAKKLIAEASGHTDHAVRAASVAKKINSLLH